MDFNDYENKKPYPNKSDFRTYNVYYRAKTLGENVDSEKRDQLKAATPDAVIEQVLDHEGFEAARREYYDEEARIKERFWLDFAEEEGVSPDHPKFELLKDVAWSNGHASGYYYDVYNFARQLADFLK